MPRYKSRACECSVYSCLTQFTAPELLTGNNKWACERCSKVVIHCSREMPFPDLIYWGNIDMTFALGEGSPKS